MKVAIIGCGLIGNKRLKHLGQHALSIAADTDLARAKQLAESITPHAAVTANWQEAVAHPQIEAVIIATTPNVMPEIALGALRAGKHVLVDKPAATGATELRPVADLARELGLQVRVGFNHRYHPALLKAHELFTNGAIGDLMYIRGRYGHGGRLGYEKEWRASADISGGGELVDQGSHLIDLSRWFLGDFTEVSGCAPTYYWEMNVDDNAFMMLTTARKQVAWLHASWTEWKNMFSFEIFGRVGKLQIDGLGGSYGTETLTFYKMKPELGPPDVERFEFPANDASWQTEFDHFVRDIETGISSGPTADDAVAVWEIVEKIYATRGELVAGARQ
ncbi:MAG TPA: Gfo/Idh/MocA family oxidoreductase [Planktothrix sp.]|jgi:predicted dehydrogenase